MALPTPTTQTVVSDLAAIGLSARIPPFWADMPKIWFSQFEAILGPQHQSEQVKYEMLVSKLAKEELSQVGDLISNPPEQQRYTTLKNRLLKTFQASVEAQFNKLVSEMDLGQQRPSQLLAKMSELAKNSGAAGDTVRNLWLSRLPACVRAILATNKAGTKLDDLAEMADKIMDNLRNGELSVVDATHAHSSATTSATIDVNIELLNQLRNMSLELKTLRNDVNSIGQRQQHVGRGRWRHNRSRSGSRYRTRTPQRTPQSPDWLCRYHFRFRDLARRCESPCNWVKSNKQEN